MCCAFDHNGNFCYKRALDIYKSMLSLKVFLAHQTILFPAGTSVNVSKNIIKSHDFETCHLIFNGIFL